MDETNARRAGRSSSFFTSLPGILTGLAAIVTALAGAGFYGLHGGSAAASGGAGATSTVTVSPTGPPPSDRPALPSLRLGQLADSSLGEDGQVQQLIQDCGSGDESACYTILDALVSGCDDGSPNSCDALYLVSPAGSDLEEFGATCGYRVSDEMAGMCSDL